MIPAWLVIALAVVGALAVLVFALLGVLWWYLSWIDEQVVLEDETWGPRNG